MTSIVCILHIPQQSFRVHTTRHSDYNKRSSQLTQAVRTHDVYKPTPCGQINQEPPEENLFTCRVWVTRQLAAAILNATIT